MNILLQNKNTLHYVQKGGGWTDHQGSARVFDTGLEAMLFCLDHQFGNMQILGNFTDARLNFAFPVTDLRGD
ncbi:MAG TPA: hypothetical protein VL793_10030 [Patescibacteria group bacterium]|jgi:hypothetical protein|nr:hypothetical protein [Patescibacteria group bacterium]